MTTQNGRAFNEWLRAQLKAKKMSQRQLAQQSGVDHSTISRLIRGDRMPSLGTATKLARGLRELRDDADTPQYLGLVASGSTNPDRACRVRPAGGRAALRGAGAPDHGVLPRRADAPLRPDLPAEGPGSSPDRTTERALGTPVGSSRSLAVGRVGSRGGGVGSGTAVSTVRRSRAPQAGSPAATRHFPGHDPDRPPPSGSRGQRTPASGAPAFAIPAARTSAAPGR